jgi:hypothetical protein
MEMVHDRCSTVTLLTEFSTALTTILHILFQYCCKYCYSDSRNLWTVMKAGGLAPYNLIQPTISLEMPVPSQGQYGFYSFPVVDWFCLFIFVWVLTFPLDDCSEFDNFVITLINSFLCHSSAFSYTKSYPSSNTRILQYNCIPCSLQEYMPAKYNLTELK